MLSTIKETDLFYEYYAQWIGVYKEGAVRKVTMDKYRMTLSWLKRLAPNLRLCDMSRVTYQQILNEYANYHERQTTMDFHHQLKGAIMDAVDDGLISRDPTRKAIIKGKTPTPKKMKYLNQYELHTLICDLDLQGDINWDWLILLIAKTGMRFSEAIALTPKDFDFSHQMLSINKTWDYKGDGGFLPTKNKSSVRKIQIDWQTVIQFSELVKKLPADKPIFVKKERIYNSTVNDILARHCKRLSIIIKRTETQLSRLCVFSLLQPHRTEVRLTGKYRYLTFEDRKKIEAWHLLGDRPVDIAARLSVHHTTIYKELQRGATGALDANQREGYSAELAERRLRESFKRRGKRAPAAQ